MGAETPGHRAPRPANPAGKKLPEKRQGFLIYLPKPVHAKLKAEALRRAVSMSELVSTAVAQFLSVEGPPRPKSGESQPFVGQYGAPTSIHVDVPAQRTSAAESSATADSGTFEVED